MKPPLDPKNESQNVRALNAIDRPRPMMSSFRAPPPPSLRPMPIPQRTMAKVALSAVPASGRDLE